MKSGYRIRLPHWGVDEFIYHICGIIEKQDSEFSQDHKSHSRGDWLSHLDELLSTDWEIVTQGIVKDFPITYSD